MYSDQSKSNLESLFDKNCTRLVKYYNLTYYYSSTVARIQSNDIIERVHRELAIRIFP